MKILFVGRLWEGSTTLERMCTLKRLGFDILPFNLEPYAALGTRIERSFLARANYGRGIVRLNRNLCGLAKRERFDVVWVEKGVWIYPETVELLQRRSARKLAIHYTPDPQLLLHKSRHFTAAIPRYDLLITTKSFEVDLYEKHGAVDTLLVLQGFGRRFLDHRGEKQSAAFHSDVCFIGHRESHYVQRIRAISHELDDVKVWGPGWSRYSLLSGWAHRVVQGDGVWGDDYPLALASAKLALGLLSKRIPETTTTRTFEIPATATFMLAERTDDHLALFEEGKEAEFFSSDEELRSKARFYLANDTARARIAGAGRERCVTSGYSTTHQMRCIFKHLAERGRVGPSHMFTARVA